MFISRDLLDCQDFEEQILLKIPLEIRDSEENFSVSSLHSANILSSQESTF